MRRGELGGASREGRRRGREGKEGEQRKIEGRCKRSRELVRL